MARTKETQHVDDSKRRSDERGERAAEAESEAQASAGKVDARMTDAYKSHHKNKKEVEWPAGWTKPDDSDAGSDDDDDPPDTLQRAAAEAYMRLGVSKIAAIKIVQNGYGDPDELMYIKDDEAATRMLKNVRNPGGKDDGQHVLATTDRYIALTAFGVRLSKRVERPFQWEDVTKDWCNELASQRDLEVNNPHTLESIMSHHTSFKKSDGPSTVIEKVDGALYKLRTPDGVPLLAYVREDPWVPTAGDYGVQTVFDTPDEEMLARAPIFDEDKADYSLGHIMDLKASEEERQSNLQLSKQGPYSQGGRVANTFIWDVLEAMLGHLDIFIHAKPGKRKKNGRYGYFLIKYHMFGKTYILMRMNALGEALKLQKYTGERREHTLQQHINKFKSLFSQVDELVELGENNPYDEGKRVQMFCVSVEHGSYDATKSIILASETARCNFDACTRAFLDHLEVTPSLKAIPKSVNRVSAVGTRGKGGYTGKRTGGSGKDAPVKLDWNKVKSAKDRLKEKYFRDGDRAYIPGTEYKALDAEERRAVHEIREDRRNSGIEDPNQKHTGKRGNRNTDSTLSKMERSIASLSKTVEDKLSYRDTYDSDSSMDSYSDASRSSKRKRKSNKGKLYPSGTSGRQKKRSRSRSRS